MRRTVVGMTMAAAAVAVAGCNGMSDWGHRGEERELSGETGSRSVALEGFEEVSLSGPDHVVVTAGDEFSIRAEGDEAVLDSLEFEVRGDELRIERENNSWFGSGPGGVATIHVTMPSIRGVSIAGSGNVTVDRAEVPEFSVEIAGSGDLEVTALATGKTNIDIAGSGGFKAAGISTAIELDIAGSGDVDISELQAETMEVDIAGSGDVEAYVTGEVEASFIGSGDVRVRGGATCRSNSVGSGDLICD